MKRFKKKEVNEIRKKLDNLFDVMDSRIKSARPFSVEIERNGGVHGDAQGRNDYEYLRIHIAVFGSNREEPFSTPDCFSRCFYFHVDDINAIDKMEDIDNAIKECEEYLDKFFPINE